MQVIHDTSKLLFLGWYSVDCAGTRTHDAPYRLWKRM